jgi:hypothetical protein
MHVPVRSAALVLALSLVSPAVVTALCEIACLHEQHHQEGAATQAECHGHNDSTARMVAISAAADVLCHDDAAAPAAVIAGGHSLSSMPAVVNLPQEPAIDLRAPLSVPGGMWFRPPNLLLIATQLRI